ncbi:EamA family transporter [Vibrio fluvialis]|uniref:Permease of the drug/metabolite transporter (DMT) superfamily n=1 Tax=Vibrio fluvialis PG41 TaxID=1336752 RepID=S7JEW1_VIBFL|nr:EamA family transporter [Vibrio fluvialis]EKO3541906.1 EamA family transporter [Vibrio fluvialis]EPP22586.1 Permease of the drug/metabolite transporter (DMT) superfamily [Vibrio fluvialis PG41]MBY8105766.1 EamA family transporter [Vibrio fluvialis]WIE02227.1 EamA family transporter [Vibrio fluvialis]HDM8049438.1 EamA family transporter [Vibrio fluvialis]
MNRIQQIKTIALTAIAPIVWGSTYIVTTEALPPESPLIASTIRSLPAGVLLVLISRAWPTGLWWLRMAVLGFLNIGLFFYCLFFAATYLPGGMASMVMSIQPVIVMSMSWYLLSSNFSSQQLIASGLGILGVGLLVLNSSAELNIEGMLTAILGTLSMALGVVLTKKWGRPTGMTMLGFTGWQLLFGGIILLPVSLWLEGIPTQLTSINYLGYGYLSLIGAILGYFLWFRGIEKLPPVTVSFLGFLSSVSACFLGYLVLNQTLTWPQLLGALAILFSIVLATPRSSAQTDHRLQLQTVKRN